MKQKQVYHNNSSIQASGLIEEFLMNKTEPILHDGTWLEHVAEPTKQLLPTCAPSNGCFCTYSVPLLKTLFAPIIAY